MNTSPDHPDFTALALGEHICGTPAQAVLEALRTSVAARNEAEQIRLTAQSLGFVLKGQPPLRLDAARREAIFHADPAAVRARFAAEERAEESDEPAALPVRKTSAWIYPTAAAAAVAVAAIVVMRMLPGYTPPSQRGQQPVAEGEPKPTGKVIVSLPSASAPNRERPASPPAPAVVTRENKPPLPDKGQDLAAPPEPPAIVKDQPPSLPKFPAPEIPAPPPAVKPAPRPPPADYATPLSPPPKRSR